MCFASGSFDNFAVCWEQAFQFHGVTPHQSPGHIRAESERADVAAPIIIEAADALSAFRVTDGTAICLVEGAGALQLREDGFNADRFLSAVQQMLGVHTIHMPLLYQDVEAAQAFLGAQGGQRLDRRPSSIISPPFDPETVLARSAVRLGSRARRRVRRFKKAALVFQELSAEPAIQALDRIEQRSWKSRCGQDMHSRHQFGAYAARLRSGELTMTAVMAQETPVAYRIDTCVGDVLFALKWSFDEAWHKTSPGFSLLAVDLPRRCQALGVAYADLFGSPDLLKDAVSTGERQRSEFVWPSGSVADGILAERHAHDSHTANAHAQGKSIRNAYDNNGELR